MTIPHFCNACSVCCPVPATSFDDLLPRFDPDASYDPNGDRLDRLKRRRAELVERDAEGDELEQIDAQIAAEEIWG